MTNRELLVLLDEVITFAKLDGYSVFVTPVYVHVKKEGKYLRLYEYPQIEKYCIELKLNELNFKTFECSTIEELKKVLIGLL